MADASDALLKLRPVRFRYKGQAGERKHFGLIAEEFEEVLPELVVHDACGNPETVLYHEMPAMVLNELLKQQAEIALLRDRLAEREALLRSTPGD
jgi:Chaperone of endosialidase